MNDNPLGLHYSHDENDTGVHLLDDIAAFLGRFVAYPSEAVRIAHTLWIAHTHVMSAWEATPRMAFLSPEPGSGKTRALEITEMLVPRPVEAVNVTPAYLFRKVADPDGLPTILFDEIDTVFGPKARDNEEIRGLLNAGHRRGAVAGRCVIKNKLVTTEEIPAYCAVAMAGLGDLPDTILSRSIIVRMRRRAPDEIVEPYRRRVHQPQGEMLRERLDAWAGTVVEQLALAMPDMPQGVMDRDADVWEPLISIADIVGGDWPRQARVAAVTLVTLSKVATPSLGVLLLRDLKTVFGQEEQKSTSAILSDLYQLDETPWADIKGKALTDRGLAQRLGKYDIKPKLIRLPDNVVLRGYQRSDFVDAWKRYLPDTSGSASP